MTNGSHPRYEISAYVDGDLDAARRAEVEAHLAGCEACAALAADLRGLAVAAAALEDRAPAADLWPAIRERIEGQARVIPIAPAARRRITLTWTQLAAAGIATVVLAGGSMWLALSGRGPTPGGAPAVVAEGPAPEGDAVLVADFADETYESAVADLEAALEASRDELDPETVSTIERNLGIIDQAIEETRRALEADPNSVYLSAHLAEQMQRKLSVLRTAATVANPSI